MPYATLTYLANDRVWVRVDLIISDSNLLCQFCKGDYQYVLEVSEDATFEYGGCDGRRKQESFALTFSGEHETVEIYEVVGLVVMRL